MATSIEAQGHTVDEAIQIALNQLGLSRDKVEIEILHHPRRGLLGIGARRAKVRATVRESVMADGEEFDMSGGTALDDKPRRRRRRGGRNRSGRGEDRPEGAAETAARTPTAGAGRDAGRTDGDRRGSGGRRAENEGNRPRGEESGRSREDRRGGRGRGDRSGAADGRSEGQARGGQQRGPHGHRDGQRDGQRPRDGEESREPGRQDSRDRSSQRGRQGSRDQRDQGDRREQNRPPADPQAQAGPGAPAAGVPLARSLEVAAEAEAAPVIRSEQMVASKRSAAAEEPLLDAETLEAVRARADELIREMLAKMGFSAEVTSSVDEAAQEAVVSVRSDSEGLLIGRRGQTLDSLEHILNRMVLRGESYVEGRILLDIGDYRRRRRESLDELAARLRTRAVTERRSVQVSPMSPRDRKFFAQAFADDDAVEVRALGAGFYRRVIVAPAGMGAAAIAEAEASGGVEEDAAESDGGFSGAEAES